MDDIRRFKGGAAYDFLTEAMMTQMNLRQAADHLAELVQRARAGEEIVIVEDGRPLARLVSADADEQRRGFGMFKGEVWVAEDFDAPLSEEELGEWEK